MMHIDTLFILLACLFGVLMTLSVGANDLANVMSTTMGSKAVSVRQALIIAVIFEFAGAFFGSGSVSETLRNGIINTQVLSTTPDILLFGMLASLLAGTVWMSFASYFGLPVSVTNTIVGAIVGFGAIVIGPHAVHWHVVSAIAISWIASPTIAGVAAYLLFLSIQRFILASATPFIKAKQVAPLYLFAIGVVFAIMIIVKGLKHFQIAVHPRDLTYITLSCGFIFAIFGRLFIGTINNVHAKRLKIQFISAEKIFAVLMAMTACIMVFAHGSNDVAIAVGPMAAVITIAQSHGKILYTAMPPTWITGLGASGVVVGLLIYGRKVIQTVGTGITSLTPSRAFAATLSAATTVIASTSLGIPVSTTQTLVGGILGVGLARGIGALNLRIVRNIFMSWVITIPVGAGLTILFFYLFKLVF